MKIGQFLSNQCQFLQQIPAKYQNTKSLFSQVILVQFTNSLVEMLLIVLTIMCVNLSQKYKLFVEIQLFL